MTNLNNRFYNTQEGRMVNLIPESQSVKVTDAMTDTVLETVKGSETEKIYYALIEKLDLLQVHGELSDMNTDELQYLDCMGMDIYREYRLLGEIERLFKTHYEDIEVDVYRLGELVDTSDITRFWIEREQGKLILKSEDCYNLSSGGYIGIIDDIDKDEYHNMAVYTLHIKNSDRFVEVTLRNE